MTYWALNAIFLAAVAAVALATVVSRRSPRWRSIGLALLVMLAMTAVFDNVMIAVGLVGYDESKISGVFIGVAPLEDFAYAVAAVVLLPCLWALTEKASTEKASTQKTPTQKKPTEKRRA